MPWIKVDDHYDEHRKFADAGPLGHALWLAGMAYCNRNLTDGYIPWSVARNLLSWEFLGQPEDGSATIFRIAIMSVDGRGDEDYEVVDSRFVVDILIRVGLWVEDGFGYRVHDYEQYQPTKAQVEADRAAKVAAGQAGGRASARARGQAPATADEQQDASTDPSRIQPRTRTRTRTTTLGTDVPSALVARDDFEATIGESEEPYRTLETLTLFPVQRVEPNAIRTLDALCDRRGIPAVLDALRAEAPSIPTQPPAPWQLIAAARNRLEPFGSSKPTKPEVIGKGGVSAEEAERAFGVVR